MKYTVTRQHFSGGIVYREGSIRECDERLGKELMANGLIAEKADNPPKNKAKQEHRNKQLNNKAQ